jgi:hypothetical protein
MFITSAVHDQPPPELLSVSLDDESLELPGEVSLTAM